MKKVLALLSLTTITMVTLSAEAMQCPTKGATVTDSSANRDMIETQPDQDQVK